MTTNIWASVWTFPILFFHAINASLGKNSNILSSRYLGSRKGRMILVNNRLIISISFQGPSYVTISADWACHHRSGGYPWQCYLGSGIDESECESSCTSNSWCIGYSFTRGDYCYLVPSSEVCSTECRLKCTGTVATSIDQLESGGSIGICRGKAAGNNKCKGINRQ